MRTSADQQSPHGYGIDESGKVESLKLTPPGIHYELPEDDPLSTPGTLRDCPPLEGMEFNSLSPATATAARGEGFQTDIRDDDNYKADGVPVTETEQRPADPAVVNGSDPTTGFLGRSTLLTER